MVVFFQNMASTAPVRDSNTQRKILEDLKLKNQLILKQGVSQNLNLPAASQQTTGWSSGTDGQIAGTNSGNNQRSNFMQATAQSFGYLVPQDSSFGNAILPVLPRLENNLMTMKLKELESYLQDIKGFHSPKVNLEQYETPAHIAARIVHTIQSSFGELEGRIVADLGCGCGMLTIGAVLMGSSFLVGIDIDSAPLEICQENLSELNIESVDLVNMDVKKLTGDPRWQKTFDTVILNPPFGTKHNHGLDMIFLKTALDLAKISVFSLHKSSTREHISKKASEWGIKMKVIAQLGYNLPCTYRFHKKNSIDIEVDFIRFSFV